MCFITDFNSVKYIYIYIYIFFFFLNMDFPFPIFEDLYFHYSFCYKLRYPFLQTSWGIRFFFFFFPSHFFFPFSLFCYVSRHLIMELWVLSPIVDLQFLTQPEMTLTTLSIYLCSLVWRFSMVKTIVSTLEA